MVDILAVVAHPDDAELNIAGTLLRTADRGGSFAICDLTRGERGTRGSATLRAEETAKANRALGIDPTLRWNLGIPDGDIRITHDNLHKLVQAIRHFRPSILLFPWNQDRHPDHENAHRLTREAYFNAGLTALDSLGPDGTPQLPFRPERLYTFFHTWEAQPDFIVDISAQFEQKLEAIAAYGSQFTVPGLHRPELLIADKADEEPATFISGEDYMEALIARMRHWGFMIGAKYGEAFKTIGSPLKVDDIRHTL